MNRCSDMIKSLTMVIDGETVNVISTYAPQVGLSEEEKECVLGFSRRGHEGAPDGPTIDFSFGLGRITLDGDDDVLDVLSFGAKERDLHLAFLALEKAYDSVLRELIWKTLIEKGKPRRYIRVIRDMYDGAKTRVRTSIRNMEFFPLEVWLHQGSTISPYLFALILDELSRGIQDDIPWCLILDDDIVLVAKLAKGWFIHVRRRPR
nr:hypothetical protein [Tanacetum cinerariifolium]